VLWPRGWRLAVVNHGGLPATLPYLADLSEQWAASGEGHRSPLWAQAHELSGHMLTSWLIGPRMTANSPSEAGMLLTLLSRLGDTAHIERFLTEDGLGTARSGTDRALSGYPKPCGSGYRTGWKTSNQSVLSASPCHMRPTVALCISEA
jgi:hypothetical protein